MSDLSIKAPKTKLFTLIKKFTVKNVLKLIAVLIIITVYTLLLGRMFLAKDRGIMDKYLPTEEFLSIASENTQILTQNINYTMDENGYYRISNLVYIPETGELQINVRYNNSTIDVLNERYSDSSDKEEPFCYELIDNNNNSYSFGGYIAKNNMIYNFRKLLFKGIDFESVERLYLDVKYVGDVNTDAPMSVRFTVYNSSEEEHKSDLKIDNSNRYKFTK